MLSTDKREIPLAALCSSITDGDHQAPPRSDVGVPFITISAMNGGRVDLSKATRFVPPAYAAALKASRQPKRGDILYSVTGSIGIPALLRDDRLFVFQRHIAIIRPDPSCCDSNWLAYLLAAPQIKEQATAVATGTAQLTVPLSGLRSFKNPSHSLKRQREQALRLDALTARLASTRAELERVPTLVALLKRQAMEACFANSAAGDIVRLGTILKGVEAGKNMRCEERPPRPGERGVVKVSAVTWGRFDSTKSKTLPPDYEPPEVARIREGDLLISRANTLELVGAVALVENEPKDLFLSDKVLRLLVADNEKKWVLWFLRSPTGRQQIEQLATGNQLSMRNISQDALRRIELSLPDEKKRDELITSMEAAFARTNRFEAEAARACKLLDRLEAAILSKAFRGELIPQDSKMERL
jgi:type I restriction enzyme S subunit